jgi:6-methylsalicylate decarboxylase
VSRAFRVDVHQHFWPEPFVTALARRSAPPRLTDHGRLLELREGTFEADLPAHELDARLARLDRDEIDVAVVSLPPTLEIEEHEDLREAYHEGIVEVAATSKGRLRPLAAGESREGFVGASVSAAAFAAGVEPLVADLASAGGFLFVHPGPPAPSPGSPPWWAALVDYTAQMQAAFAAWVAREPSPVEVPVVFAILAGGAPFQLERFASRRVDVSALLGAAVYFDTASYGRRALELCLATTGARHLVYGSDAPVIDPRPTLDAVRGFGEGVADAVCSENPMRLLSAREPNAGDR